MDGQMDNSNVFDWCSFFALFWNDRGIKCHVNIPDTVLFRHGQLLAWWATNKEGAVQKHDGSYTSVEAIRKRFIQVARDETRAAAPGGGSAVAVCRLHGRPPRLLPPHAFNQLCEVLADRLEGGMLEVAPDTPTPSVLQAYVQPLNDLRYVTTYINNGTTVTCHSFQRRYSRRYSQQDQQQQQQQQAAAASTPPSAAISIRTAGNGATGSAADLPPPPAFLGPAETEVQGPVDSVLKAQLARLTHHIATYIFAAHGLVLAGAVCEYVCDCRGKLYLLGLLKADWAPQGARLASEEWLESDAADPDATVAGGGGWGATGDDWEEDDDDEGLGGGSRLKQPRRTASPSHVSPHQPPQQDKAAALPRFNAAYQSMMHSLDEPDPPLKGAAAAAAALATARPVSAKTGAAAASAAARGGSSNAATSTARPASASPGAAAAGAGAAAAAGATAWRARPQSAAAGPRSQAAVAGARKSVVQTTAGGDARSGQNVTTRSSQMLSALITASSSRSKSPGATTTAVSGARGAAGGTTRGTGNRRPQAAPSLHEQMKLQAAQAAGCVDAEARALEAERARDAAQADVADVEGRLSTVLTDLTQALEEREDYRQRAETAEARLAVVESELSQLRDKSQQERGVMLETLRDMSQREQTTARRLESLETDARTQAALLLEERSTGLELRAQLAERTLELSAAQAALAAAKKELQEALTPKWSRLSANKGKTAAAAGNSSGPRR